MNCIFMNLRTFFFIITKFFEEIFNYYNKLNFHSINLFRKKKIQPLNSKYKILTNHILETFSQPLLFLLHNQNYFLIYVM